MLSSARAWFDLIRVYNVPVPLCGMLVGAHAVDANLGWGDWLTLIVSALLGCTATQAFNDYEDREVDALNAGFRPLPAGRLRPQTVLRGGWLAAIAWALLAGWSEPRAALIVFATIAMTRHYSRFKRWSLIHHVLLPAALGLMPAYGALIVGGSVPTLAWWVGVSIVLIDLDMNIVGTFKDLWAGSARERVLPAVMGAKPAVAIALSCGLLGIGLQALAPLLGLCGANSWVPLALALSLALHSRGALYRRPCAAVGYAALQSGRLTECLAFPASLAGLLPAWHAAAIIAAITLIALGTQRLLPEARLPREAHDLVA